MKLDPPSQPSPDLDGAIDLNIEEPLCAVFRRKLKAENQKYTPERAHILNTIIEFDGLFEADTLLETVRKGGFRVSKATIYRTLKLLEEAGIIQQIPFDRDQSHYQLAYGKKPDTVLINVDTGEVEAINVPELIALRDKICQDKGLNPEGHRLQIFVRSS
ncbi:MAG: transcriptional repressor [Planctomycetota bacterium]